MSKLSPVKRYRGIPEPGMTIEELYDTVAALQELVETMLRTRGMLVDSVVTVDDLVYLGILERGEVRGLKWDESGKVVDRG